MISSGNSDINNRLQQLETTVNNLTAIFDKLIKKSKYDAMTVAQLKEIVKKLGIKVKSNIKKGELIAILLDQD